MNENEKRQQIVEGALKAFSQYGYHKSSIKMVAKAAGIKSSALIYHYFEDKKALLEAIIKEHTPLKNLPLINEEMRQQMMDVPPEILLPKVIHGVLSIQDNPDIAKLVVIVISEAAQMPEIADAAFDVQTLMINFLTGYLQHQVSMGHLRQHNSEQAARVLASTILINILANKVFPRLGEGFGEREAYVQQVVDIFLNGLRSEK